jgi:hypothetical protein
MQTRIGLASLLLLAGSLTSYGQTLVWPTASGGNGHKYQVFNVGGLTWFSANSFALEVGGHLATITSAEENQFITSVLNLEPNNEGLFYWVGGVQPLDSVEPEGGWTWVTGEPFSYSNWNDGEPNNQGGGEDRIHLWNSTNADGRTWNDEPSESSTPTGFIVEFGPVAVPEPETYAGCAAVALAGFAGWRRWRRA